jgi:GrpB-like predicted nucleotidyltransferase (UPF0157 family)
MRGEHAMADDERRLGEPDAAMPEYEERLQASHVWPRQYAEQVAAIRAALGPRVLRMEHAGSTSVSGLAAKPIPDITLAVADPADKVEYVPALEPTGYATKPLWLQVVVRASPSQPARHKPPPTAAAPF